MKIAYGYFSRICLYQASRDRDATFYRKKYHEYFNYVGVHEIQMIQWCL